MARLSLYLFGGFHATLDGEPLAGFRSDKVRALLAYLALEGEKPLRRDYLAGLLWEGYTPNTARHSLRMVLSNLRRLLCSLDILTTDRQTVRFNTAHPEFWCDVRHFEALLGALPSDRASTPADPAHRVCLRAALEIYQGDFLEGLSSDSLPFEIWQFERKTRYRHEIAHLSTANRRSPIAKPKPKIQNLQPKISLPLPLTDLIGREVEVHRIKQFLQIRELVTVTGLGGIGKSHLAIQVATEVAADYPDGMFFVPLAALEDPDLLIFALAESLQIRLTGAPDPRYAKAQLLDALRSRNILLVLDDFHQLHSGAALLTELLQTAPGVKLLVTSRERLRLHGEAVLELQGLEANAAVQLFLYHAQRAAPDFVLTAENEEAVATVCRLVEGMPLGLELAAAWAGILAPEDIAANIQNDLTLLSTTRPDIPERRRSVHAVFDALWHLLSEGERGVLRQLSVFRGGFDAQAAQAVAGASPFFLNALADKSFLHLRFAGRYEMHELLRQYAAAQLRVVQAEQRATQDRHSAYYASFLQAREGRLTNDPTSQAEVLTEFNNVRAAWQQALAPINVAVIEKSFLALSRFYWLRGYFNEAARVFTHAAARLRLSTGEVSTPDSGSLRLLGKLLSQQALFLLVLSRLEEAAVPAQEAARLGQIIQDADLEANAHLRLAGIAWAQGDYALARAANERCLALAQSAGLPEYEMKGLAGLAAALKNQFDYPAAIAAYLRALPLARQFENRHLEGTILNGLGTLYEATGDFSQAILTYEQALLLQKKLGDRHGAGTTQMNLGLMADLVGNYESAKARYAEAWQLLRETQTPHFEIHLLAFMGLLFHHLGENETARQYCEQALGQEGAPGSLPARSTALAVHGHVLAALDCLDEAREAYRQTIALHEQLRRPVLVAVPLAGLARIALQQGDAALALRHVEAILPQLEALPLEGPVEPFRVYLTCYCALAANGDPRAPGLHARARERLFAQAEKITDPALRRSFMENVPAHRELAAHQYREYNSDGYLKA